MALTSDDCRRYLESLDMGEELVERGLESVAAIRKLLPVQPEDIFVSERWDGESGRGVGSLWLLGPGFVSEGYRFATESRFDITRVDGGISRLVVDRNALSSAAAGARPRLAVTVNFESGIVGSFEAIGDNCHMLERILEQRLVPFLAVG